MSKIAIIIGTTRSNRFADKAAAWLHKHATARTDATYELVDLREYPLPFFDEARSLAWAPSSNEVSLRWQKRLTEFDGYIFVAGEYNRGAPAVLKNALDYAYKEWNRKPVAFMAYGGAGGARMVEQLRLNCVELQMAPIRNAVHVQGQDFMSIMTGKSKIEDIAYLPQLATDMLDQLAWWTKALKEARDRG